MAKFNGQEGRRITTDRGTHVFIPEGKDVKEVLNQMFDEHETGFIFDDEGERPKGGLRDRSWKTVGDLSLEEILENSNQKEIKNNFIKATKGKIKFYSNEYSGMRDKIKERLYKQIANMDIEDEELFNTIIDNVLKNKQFKYMRIKSGVIGGATQMSREWFGECHINMNISPVTGSKTQSDLFHELGHCLDYAGMWKGDHLSSTYVSKKYNDTLTNILKEEMIENVEDVIKEIQNLIQKSRIKMDRDTDENVYNDYYQIYQSYRSLEDMVQGSMGDDFCKSHNVNLGHKPGYYDDDNERHRGTEFFAELTDNLINDKNKTLLNVCKKYMPKTTEIYYEILKERFDYGRK